MQDYRECLNYLNKALKVFEENGLKKGVQEIKQKMKMAKEMKDKGRKND